MASMGLKPWEDGDAEEGKAIIAALASSDQEGEDKAAVSFVSHFLAIDLTGRGGPAHAPAPNIYIYHDSMLAALVCAKFQTFRQCYATLVKCSRPSSLQTWSTIYLLLGPAPSTTVICRGVRRFWPRATSALPISPDRTDNRQSQLLRVKKRKKKKKETCIYSDLGCR